MFTLNFEIMKQRIYMLGLLTASLVFLGAFFKVNHYPGAAIMLTAGISLLIFVFLPAALINHYRAEGNNRNKILYFVTWLTCFVIFTGMLFKILHWPGANYAILIALPFPYVVFLPVFLVVTGKNKNFNIYNTVFVLFLLAAISAFSVLLALNVSRQQIADSYNLSGNYRKSSLVLREIPGTSDKSPVSLAIDDVLKIVGEYRDLILKEASSSEEEWDRNPVNLRNPESADIAPHAIFKAEGLPMGKRLNNSLKTMIAAMEKCSGCEDIAGAAPVILGFDVGPESEPNWAGLNLRANNLSWALISLDALEYNLEIIKSSLPAD